MGGLDAGSATELRHPKSKTMSNGYGNMGDGVTWLVKAIIVGSIILAGIAFALGAWIF